MYKDFTFLAKLALALSFVRPVFGKYSYWPIHFHVNLRSSHRNFEDFSLVYGIVG
jgi:hypothetical protein